jgi:biotin carboxyl carrier protein
MTRPVERAVREDPAAPAAVRVSLAPSLAYLDLPPVVVDPGAPTVVDGRPVTAALERLGGERAVLTIGAGPHGERHALLLLPPQPAPGGRGIVGREVVVDGWRVLVEVEPERRAALRERATRGGSAAAHSGPTEMRAVIPGRVLSVSVAPGETVAAGQQLLVVEAMKMQNEVRAPREGTVDRVAVLAGQTIELGDVLLVLS